MPNTVPFAAAFGLVAANNLVVNNSTITANGMVINSSGTFVNTYLQVSINGEAKLDLVSNTENYASFELLKSNTSGTYLRWKLSKETTTESGGNVGSNFKITRYSDVGTELDSPFLIHRKTGNVVFSNTVTAPLIYANTLQINSISVNGNTAITPASDTIDLIVPIPGTTGVVKSSDVHCDFSGQILQWTLLADVSGNLVVDIWKDTYANYPPTVADTITASAKPTLSSVIKNQNSTLAGWTNTFSAGDIFRFNVDSIATVTSATLILKCRKTS